MPIEDLARNYQVNSEIVEVLKQSKIVFLVGIMASGKDAIQKSLVSQGNYKTIITHTTRQPRYNEGVLEQDGVDYHFVDRDTMADYLNEHKLVEINHFSDNYYATHIDEFKQVLNENKTAICNVDVNGVKSFHDLIPDNITPIFVIPPDYEIWLNRAIGRYRSKDDFFAVWEKRREFAIVELEHALAEPYYIFVVNDEINKVVNLVNSVVQSKVNTTTQYQVYARQVAQEFLNAIKNTSTR